MGMDSGPLGYHTDPPRWYSAGRENGSGCGGGGGDGGGSDENVVVVVIIVEGIARGELIDL